MAEAARFQLRVEEGVDHREAVAQDVGDRDRDQGSVTIGAITILEDQALHRAAADHGGIIAIGHFGHAALVVACFHVITEQAELFARGLGLDRRTHKRGIAGHGAAVIAGLDEFACGHTHAAAGIAARAGGPVGDGLAASETGLAERIVDGIGIADGEIGERLALAHAGQVGARAGVRHVETQRAPEPCWQNIGVRELHDWRRYTYRSNRQGAKIVKTHQSTKTSGAPNFTKSPNL